MSYNRTVPRDLFNESKLLKCLGRLVLLKDEPPRGLPIEVNDNDVDDAGFLIHQNANTGGLFCSNLRFYLRGEELHLEVSYNAKNSPWPLVWEHGSDGGCVFNDDGSLDDEFVQLCWPDTTNERET